MKMIMAIGIAITFMAAFFVFGLGNALIGDVQICVTNSGGGYTGCVSQNIDMDTLATLFMVISFIMVDIGAVYLMNMSWKAQ